MAHVRIKAILFVRYDMPSALQLKKCRYNNIKIYASVRTFSYQLLNTKLLIIFETFLTCFSALSDIGMDQFVYLNNIFHQRIWQDILHTYLLVKGLRIFCAKNLNIFCNRRRIMRTIKVVYIFGLGIPISEILFTGYFNKI